MAGIATGFVQIGCALDLSLIHISMKLPTYCNHQSEAQLSPGNIAFVIIVLFGISESIAPKDSVDMLRMNAVGPRIRIATRRKMNA